MANITVSQLAAAQTPLNASDILILSRDGLNLNQFTLQQLQDYVTAAGDPGDVEITLNDITNQDFFPTFVQTTTGRNVVLVSTKIKFNPSSGLLSANFLSGNGQLISNLSASNITAGVLSPLRGGTGNNTAPASGEILVGNSSGTYAKVVPTATNGITLTSNGSVFTVSSNATAANTINTIVSRDGSGNFSAGTITASLVGNVTGNVTGSAGTAATITTNDIAGTPNTLVYFNTSIGIGANRTVYNDPGLYYNRSTGQIITAAGIISKTPSIENGATVVTETPTSLNFSGDAFVVSNLGNDVTITANRQFAFRYFLVNNGIDSINANVPEDTIRLNGDGITITRVITGDPFEAIALFTNTDKGSDAIILHNADADPHPQYLLRTDYQNGGGGGTGSFTTNDNAIVTPDINGNINVFGVNGILTSSPTPSLLQIDPTYADPTMLQAGQVNSQGVAAAFARADHFHGIPVAAPVGLDLLTDIGLSTSFSRADHVHQMPNLGRMGSQEIPSADPVWRYAARQDSLDPRLTFTRAGVAQYRTRTGKWATAAANVPRFEWSAFSQRLGLKLEGASKNYALNSEADNASWTKTGVTAATVIDAVTPLETGSYISVTQQAGTSSHQISGTITAGADLTEVQAASYAVVSAMVQSDVLPFVRIGVTGTINATAVIELETGLLVNSIGNIHSISVIPEKSGWWRVGVQFDPDITGFNIAMVSDSLEIGAFDVITPEMWSVTAIQVEANNFLSKNFTSYIKTTSTSVARATDTLVIPESIAPKTSDNFGMYFHVRSQETNEPKYSAGISMQNITIESFVNSAIGARITYNNGVDPANISTFLHDNTIITTGLSPVLVVKDYVTYIGGPAVGFGGVGTYHGTTYTSTGNITLTDLNAHLVEVRIYSNIDSTDVTARAFTERGYF